MKKRALFLPLLLALALLLTACDTAPKEPQMLYEEAPSKHNYGVYLNLDVNAGDALTDYAVAFNNFADRDAYVFYSSQGQTPVEKQFADQTAEGLAALVSEGKALAIKSNSGFQGLTADLKSLEGESFKAAEKDKFYYVYVAYDTPQGVTVEKCRRFITPHDGPAAPEKYGVNAVGAIVPGGGATSLFEMSSSYSPGYIAALKQAAADAGIEKPRVAVVETTVGTEQEMYDDMFFPVDDYPCFADAFRAAGMEPVYVPLGIDNFAEVQNTKYFADLIRSCHIVFFTGGDQAYYARALQNRDGTPALVAQAIQDVLAKGGTLGGSSAGAAAMSGTILSSGASGSYHTFYWNGAETVDVCKFDGDTIGNNVTKNEGNNLIYKGVGFVEPLLGQDIMIDTHVDARGRVGRLIIGLRDSNPTGLGLAIDETGGIRIDGATKIGTAFGTSGTYVVDAAKAQWSPAGEIGGFGVKGLIIHYLNPGDSFDFANKKVIPASDKTVITGSGEAYASTDVFGTDETGKTILTLAHSAADSVTAQVANVSLPPYLMGNSFDVVFTKTADTVCWTNGKNYPNEKYFGDYLQTAITNLQMDIISGPSRFDPSAAAGFEIESAESESNGYAVGVTFSGPLSVGFEGNNKYFKDCEVAENIPTDYVEVYDAEGNPKAQDRTYTFRINNENTLRIVLVDDVYFAEGDTIVVKNNITSLYGETPSEGALFRLVNGVWVKEGAVAEAPFTAVSAETEGNEYAVGILFTGPLSVGYSGNNDYFKDCEVPSNIPTDYVEVYDATGAVKEQDRTYTFKIIDKNTLRIVLVDDVYFAEGDKIVVKTTVTNTSEAGVVEDVVFNLTGGVWVREGEAPAAPVVPDEPVAEGPFKAVSAATEDNEYAVGVLFTGPLSVGYSGSNDYFKDCEDPANIPTDFVEVYDASGAVKEQDRTYTFKIIDKNTLRIVLVDDVYFAEGDRIVLKTSITNANGENAVEEVSFTLVNGQWVQPFQAVSVVTEDNEYAVDVLFTGELSVGYSGNNDYFKDCEDPANIPTDYVEVYDASGAVKEQDRTYTFKIIDKTTLRVVLVDDVYFAEGDKVVLKTTITDVNGGTPAAEAAFTLTGGVWVPVA